MSVVSVIKKYSDKAIGGNGRGAVDVDESYTVLLSGANASTIDILTAIDPSTGVAIPAPGQAHPDNAYLFVADWPAAKARAGSPGLYDVAVHYSSKPFREFNPSINPLLEKWKVSWRSADSEEEVDYDADGQPILNSAGDPFDPRVRMSFHDGVLSITRNQLYFDEGLADEYRGAINSDMFISAMPGQAKILAIGGERNFLGGYEFWQAHFEIGFRKGIPIDQDGGGPDKAWFKRLSDQGYREYWQDNNKYPIYEGGVPVTSPQLLDGNGAALPKGGKAVWLTFPTGPRLPFGVLRLYPYDQVVM